MIAITCPRCHSIDKKGIHRKPGDYDYECQMCGYFYVKSNAKLLEFKGEKPPRPKKLPDSWPFPELDPTQKPSPPEERL